MTKITQEELDKKLALHAAWLKNQEEGEPFTAFSLDFSDLTFPQKTALIGGNILKSSFQRATMAFVNLESINVSESDFRETNLSFANLKKCDFKYTDINGKTNFTGAKTEGMVVDTLVLGLLRMHDTVDITKLQVYNANSISIVMNYSSNEEKYLAQQLGNTFSQIVEDKYAGITTSYLNKGDKIIFTIPAIDEYQKYQIESDKTTFVEVLKNKANVEDLTDSFAQQNFFIWKIQNLANDNAMLLRLSGQQHTEILRAERALAEAHNEKIDLRSTIQDKKELIEMYKDKINDLEQASHQRLLQSPMTSFKVTLTNDSTKDIILEDVLFVTKGLLDDTQAETDDNLYVYLKEKENEPAEVLICKGTIGDMAGNLLRHPNFLRCHKNYVINVDAVVSQQNDGNNVRVRFKHNGKDHDLH
ncbi:MAG: hypothetical protein RLZZ292_3365, partial [Bacteroidota bacterium]